jgi:16S rRNA (adenine1518-N6/adenine1519-N6)-dimethyltransferase
LPSAGSPLLGPAEVVRLAAELGLRPSKRRGQTFLVDPNTVRRIVRTAALSPADVVLEVGPGLGSLTLGLLGAAARVIAVEVDPVLAAALPATVARLSAGALDRLDVLHADALQVSTLPAAPTVLVANLPYNVAVPVLLHLWQLLPGLARGLVMVQAEVADRLAAGAGSRPYGVPSAKAAWYADVTRVGQVSRNVFWPLPNVDSSLVGWRRREPPAARAGREAVFACVDAAFRQRRKSLRAALAGPAGSPAAAEQALRAAGIDPRARGESLTIADFARLADALQP